MQYLLISLDLDENEEINDARSTGVLLDLPENPSIQEVCEGLKGVDRMASDWPEKKVGAEWEDNGDVYVLNEKGRKVYQLQPVK